MCGVAETRRTVALSVGWHGLSVVHHLSAPHHGIRTAPWYHSAGRQKAPCFGTRLARGSVVQAALVMLALDACFDVLGEHHASDDAKRYAVDARHGDQVVGGKHVVSMKMGAFAPPLMIITP